MDDGRNIKEVACEITIPPIFIVKISSLRFYTISCACTMVSHIDFAILNCERHYEYRFLHKATSFERVTN